MVKSEVIQGIFAMLRALYFILRIQKTIEGFLAGQYMSTIAF